MTTYTAQQVLNAAAQGLDLGAATILDSSSAVSAALDNLEPIARAGGIGSIQFADTTPPTLMVTGTQASSDLDVIQRFQGSYTLAVAGATVAQALQVGPLPHTAIAITDSAPNVQAGLDALEGIAPSLTSIYMPLTDAYVSTLALSQQQISADADVVRLLSTGQGENGLLAVVITVSGPMTMAGAVAAEAMNGYMSKLTVVDSLANVESAIGALPTRPAIPAYSYPGHASPSYDWAAITLTDPGTPTIAIPFTLPGADANNIQRAITNLHIVDWTDVSWCTCHTSFPVPP